MIKKNIKITDADKGVKNVDKKNKCGTLAIKDIKRFQKMGNTLIFARQPFEKLVRHIINEFSDNVKVSKNVFSIIQYIIEDSPRRLLNKDLKIKSPYNTYLNYGLPPGPINSPGLESIKAALYPEKVDFLFFVAKGDGYHTFSRTEKEHNKAKRAFQKVRRKNKLKKKADKS